MKNHFPGKKDRGLPAPEKLGRCSATSIPGWVLAARVLLVSTVALIAACQRSDNVRWQGYLEAEFIHVGAPLAFEPAMSMQHVTASIEAALRAL